MYYSVGTNDLCDHMDMVIKFGYYFKMCPIFLLYTVQCVAVSCQNTSFDTVAHSILIDGLEKSNLILRNVTVEIEKTSSTPASLICGVPQGSM